MSTPTEKAISLDRLAKQADSAVVPGVDYKFGILPGPERPSQNEGESPEDYRARITTWREANPNQWGVTRWNANKLGTQPTNAEIEAEVTSGPSPEEKIGLAKAHVAQSFDAFDLISMMDKLAQVKDVDALAANPKLVATYTWIQTVQGMAVAGQTAFPPAPHTFEEVIRE